MRSFSRLGRISGYLTALTLVGGLLLPSVSHASDEITEDARQHFRAGVSFLQDPDGARYEEAYREFSAAYAASPSWKILGNLGITAMKLERDGEAVDAFEKYLGEGGDQIDPAERAQVERDMQSLKAGLVTLTITATPAGVNLVDERVPNRGGTVVNHYGPVNAPLTLRIHPGLHRVTARLAGYEDQVWEVDGAAGSTQAHTFSLEKAVPKQAAGTTTTGVAERPTPTSVYIGLAATGALAVGAAVTGVLALGKNSDYEAANEERAPNASSLRDDTETFNLVTDVLIGGAVVGAAVTSYLYFTRPTVTPAATPKDSAFHFAPVVGTNGGGVAAWGRF